MIQPNPELIQPGGELIAQRPGVLNVSADELPGLEKLTKRDQDVPFRTIDSFPGKAS